MKINSIGKTVKITYWIGTDEGEYFRNEDEDLWKETIDYDIHAEDEYVSNEKQEKLNKLFEEYNIHI